MSAVGNIQVLFSQVPFLKHLIPLLFQFKKTIIAYQKLVFQFHGTHNQNVLVVLEVSPDLKLWIKYFQLLYFTFSIVAIYLSVAS